MGWRLRTPNEGIGEAKAGRQEAHVSSVDAVLRQLRKDGVSRGTAVTNELELSPPHDVSRDGPLQPLRYKSTRSIFSFPNRSSPRPIPSSPRTISALTTSFLRRSLLLTHSTTASNQPPRYDFLGSPSRDPLRHLPVHLRVLNPNRPYLA